MRHFHIFRFAVLFLSLFFANGSIFSAELHWRFFGNLREARHYFSALPISNHEILVMGGWGNSNSPLSGTVLKTCEIIDVQANVIKTANSMLNPRTEFVALLTKDSNIVVVSGVGTSTVELFDRTTRTWKLLGNISASRRQHVAQFISDDEILIAGGVNFSDVTLQTAEIFNTTTGKSTVIQNYPYLINLAVSGITSSGTAIFAAGRSGGTNSPRNNESYSYNVTTNSWIKFSVLPSAIAAGAMLKLWDGRLFLTGGSTVDQLSGAQATSAIESKNSFIPFLILKKPRVWHCNAQWSPDTVITLGGFDYTNNNFPLNTTELIQLNKATSTLSSNLNIGRKYFAALSLPKLDGNNQFFSGRILAISGLDSTNKNTATVEILERLPCDAVPDVLTSASPSTILCPGESATLSATDGFDSYSWSPSTGLSNPNSRTPILTASSSMTYTVTAKTNSGCTRTDSVKLTVLPNTSLRLFLQNDSTAQVGSNDFNITVFADLLTPLSPFQGYTLSFDIVVDARLFYPNFFSGGEISDSRVDTDGNRIISIKVLSPSVTGSKIKIGELVGKVLMSKTARKSIEIRNQQWFSGQKYCLTTSASSSSFQPISCFLYDLEPFSSFYLYFTPNPVEKEAHLTIYNPPAGKYKVEFISSIGAVLLNEEWNIFTTQQISIEKKFDLSGLSSGIYFVRVSSPEGMQTQSLILTK